MTQINNLRQLLELLQIDETGALVVTEIKTQAIDPINVDENPEPVAMIVAINPRMQR
jgi:hypothetical protein